jgi:hypothetical protein
MARTKGKPAYPNKSKSGSYFITSKAHGLLRAASKRTGKSDSDIIEHCIRTTAPAISHSTPGFEAEL